MANEFKGQAGHSAEYFGDTRDHWWNRDYLRLLAERWGLKNAHEVLDVGCGVGHWGMLLSDHLPEDAWVIGVDRESAWVAKAAERAAAKGMARRHRYVQGSAEKLPFADGSFDLVTCQTVLIHVPDPGAVLREMIRVTRPGGLVAVCEPNNLTNALALDAASMAAPADEILALIELQLTCERGKVALGEGDNSIGQTLPARFTEYGLTDVQVQLNDRANPMTAPYASAAERAEQDALLDADERALGIWSHDETKLYYLAGGGGEEGFARLWAKALERLRRIATGLRAGTYQTAGGALSYCIAGRRPA